MSILIKTHIKDTLPKNFRLNINLKTTEIDNEEQDDGDRVFELEEGLETFDEVQNHVAPANIDEVSCDKLINFLVLKFLHQKLVLNLCAWNS